MMTNALAPLRLAILLGAMGSICHGLLFTKSIDTRRRYDGRFYHYAHGHSRNIQSRDIQEASLLKQRNFPQEHPRDAGGLLKRLVYSSLVSLLILFAMWNQSSAKAADYEPTRKLVVGQQYWDVMNSQDEKDREAKIQANQALMDYAVGTINTMYYDNTGGIAFYPRDFYDSWKMWLDGERPTGAVTGIATKTWGGHRDQLATREGVVNGMGWLTQQLNDPFSKYLTREELRLELSSQGSNHDGFLGLGAIVEPANRNLFWGVLRTPVLSEIPPEIINNMQHQQHHHFSLLSANAVSALPVLTAVQHNSPAERAGLTVGDRIVAVQKDSFLGLNQDASMKKLIRRYQGADNYFGTVDLTVAKPVYLSTSAFADSAENHSVIVGYRPHRIRLSTNAASPVLPSTAMSSLTTAEPNRLKRSSTDYIENSTKEGVSGGNAIVQYRLLAGCPPSENSLVSTSSLSETRYVGSSGSAFCSSVGQSVGYIRLTRFSKASTNAFVQAVEALEAAHADAYILDLRNNYGGIIQEAMLTASALLRDPHAVLCYTLNSRGGFTPHDVEEYVVDERYPGYLLSRESKEATLLQVKKESPQVFDGRGGWVPPSSYASLHEQHVKRGVKTAALASSSWASLYDLAATARSPASILLSSPQVSGSQASSGYHQLVAQKPLVLLVNEGTASSSEVFASALHDNGRTVAIVGTRTYGKGLIQHTFPLPDGGGLRLTVAEYLTPSLHHVTKVGGAQFDPRTGIWVGGGIQPDLACESSHGIPSNPGGDLCVGVGLDVLQEALSLVPQEQQDQISAPSHKSLTKI